MENLSHKDTLVIWHRGVQELEDGHIDASCSSFEQIIGTSAKICYNVGAIQFRNRTFSKAVLNFLMCIERDPHMAIAHFALGLSYAKEKKFNKSRQHFEKAQKCLRGNPKIDYTQLGLKFVLWECDIVYNCALSVAMMTTEYEWALEILNTALEKAKEEKQRARINEAIKSLTKNQLYEPVNLPDGVFKPPKSKVENLKDVNYLGESKVISTTSIRKKPEKLSIPGTPMSRSRSPGAFRKSPKDSSRSPSPFGKSGSESSNVFRPITTNEDKEKMSLRDGLTIWHEGVLAFEGGDVDGALDEWLKIQDPSAKILFNIAMVQMQLEDYEGARKTCHGVINKDQHLAIGHFLMGEVHLKQGHFDDAWKSFEKALTLLRKKSFIDYSQLGLAHRLYKCEILLNQAFCYQQSGKHEWTLHLLKETEICKKDPKHSVIETALKCASEGKPFEPFSLPLNTIFKPPKSKIENLAEQNFLGTSKVVSVLKGSEERVTATDQQLRVVTPPRGPSPTPPPIRAVPPAPVSTTVQNSYEHRPPPPTRTTSKGLESRVVTPPRGASPTASPPRATPESTTNVQNVYQEMPPPPVRTTSKEGRTPSPGPPSRLPPTIPIHRSKSPKTSKGPPSKQLPPSPQQSGSEYERPIAPSDSRSNSTTTTGSPSSSTHGSTHSSPHSSPHVRRKGPPKKALPPPPGRRLSSSSSKSNSISSTPSSSPRSLSPSLEPKKISEGLPRKPPSSSRKTGTSLSSSSPSPPLGIPRSPSQNVERAQKISSGPPKKALPPSPLSSGRSVSPVKAVSNGHKVQQRPEDPAKRMSGIITGAYEAKTDGELTVAEGDLVKIISQEGDWIFGEVRGRKGKMPSSHVQDHSIRLSHFN